MRTVRDLLASDDGAVLTALRMLEQHAAWLPQHVPALPELTRRAQQGAALSARQLWWLRQPGRLDAYADALHRLGLLEQRSSTGPSPLAAPSPAGPRSMSVRRTGTLLRARFPYSPALVQRMRSLRGSRWDPKAKEWLALALRVNAVAFRDWGFDLDAETQALLGHSSLSPSDVSEIPGLKGTLLKYQEEGVSRIDAAGGRLLLADEMGLGKTVQAVAWLQLRLEKSPVVIVCPASMKFVWEAAIRNWTTRDRISVLFGGPSFGQKIEADVVILNYDIAKRWKQELLDIRPQVLVLDEAHYIKETGRGRTDAIVTLCQEAQIPHVIAMTGTPALSRPIEMFNVLSLIDPSSFPSRWAFAKRYCAAHRSRFGWDFSGASHKEELYELLTSTVMLRRLKKDVLQQLPDKLRSAVPLAMDRQHEKLYAEAQQDFMGWLQRTQGADAVKRAKKAEQLVQRSALRQIAARGKAPAAIQYVRERLQSGSKVLLFARSRQAVSEFMTAFSGQAVKIDGSCAPAEREMAERTFQQDEAVRLFVGNIDAAGVGLTLTAADIVMFFEMPDTPGAAWQAEDRAHRIGRKDTVLVEYLVAHGTVDEEDARRLVDKQAVVAAVSDGSRVDRAELLGELLGRP